MVVFDLKGLDFSKQGGILSYRKNIMIKWNFINIILLYFLSFFFLFKEFIIKHHNSGDLFYTWIPREFIPFDYSFMIMDLYHPLIKLFSFPLS